MTPGITHAEFAPRLLAWFELHGRHHLPWQHNPDPYRVWVSEIMLQQTRVETVIPYFERFVQCFPDLASLAAAGVDEVLQLWSGLGYYARGRNLHSAARLIRDLHEGEFPLGIEQLLTLPGIGRSTAGAILSLGAGQCHPILDGNVKRVLTRCFAIPGWPGESAVERRLWELAGRLTPLQDTAAYNQAMMDLGATLCTRSSPDCPGCPFVEGCIAATDGEVGRYPSPKPRKALPVREVQMLVVRDPAGEVLLERRPPSGIWGGLWSLPEQGSEGDPLCWCRDQLGMTGELVEIRPLRRHTFSHYHLDITPVLISLQARPSLVMEGGKRVWYNRESPAPGGLAAPVSRILSEVTGESG